MVSTSPAALPGATATVGIRRGDIDAMQKSSRSLMPEQVLSDLTAQEAADLFAYLRSLGPGPKSP